MNTKKHFTLKKGVTKIVILLLACFITMPTLNAVNVLPNVKVNQNNYHNVHFDTKSKAIAVLNETVYAVWQGEPTKTTSNIYFSKSIDGGLSFATEINISEAAGSSTDYFASLYVSQDGKIHIAWTVMPEEGKANILYTNSEDGGTSFKTPISITTNDGSIYPCIGGYGNNVYIFYTFSGNYPKADYYFVRSTDNGTSFGSPTQINDAPCLGNVEFDGLNTMTIGADGTIYLAWTDGRRAEGEGDIFFAKSVNQGLSFSANVMVNDINGIGANAIQNIPSIAVEGDNVYVAFSDKRLGDGWLNQRAYLSVSTNGGSSFYSENPLAGYTDEFTSFDIAVSESGKLSVAISGNIQSWGVWLYESVNKGMSFSTPIALNDVTSSNLSYMQLMTFSDDYVGAFWAEDRAGSEDIYFTKTSTQTTYIPDDNFLQALIDLGYGTGVVDKCIPTSNLSGITNLDVSSKNISDLTGIEDFDALVSLNCSNNSISNFDISDKSALEELYCQINKITYLHLYNSANLITLYCSNNQLLNLDLPNNTALTYLECYQNQLSSLDVSNNTALTYLNCYSNSISSLDVSNNTALNEFYCGNNQLSVLDVSNNIALKYFSCNNNQLSVLDLTNNTALINLNYGGNQLPNLDISKNTALTGLDCSGNSTTFLDVSKHTALINLSCDNNLLTDLDLSKNSALTELWCKNNLLTGLDVRNENNANFTNFCTYGNPDLTCIYVNDKTAGYLSGWLKDATAKWANNESECGPPIAYTKIPDNNFLQALKDLGFGAGVVNNNIPTANIDTITNLDVSEKNISDLTGIKDFVALTRLKLTNNQLTNLDISKNTAIQILYCNFNQFSSLNLSANTALKTLYCNNNQLSSLDVSKNLALKTLNYSDNQLPNLDLSVNKALTSLFCSKNQLSSLNLSANTALTQLNCDNNQLQSIDVSKNTVLGTLNCNTNQLQSLDLSKNIALLYLYCDNNQITSLNVSKNTALTYLICANNQLVNLDLRNGNNANIKQFNATVNPNLTCIYVDDKTASYLSEWEKDETAKWANNEADCGTLVNEINEQTISIYPNPTTGILNIDFSGEQVQRLTISDVVGKKVFEKNKVNKTEAIDLSGFKNGIYMLIVQTEYENRSFKIIKE